MGPAGSIWWRIRTTIGSHVLAWNEFRHYGSPYRFDPHPVPVCFHPDHGIWYTAQSPKSALAETFAGPTPDRQPHPRTTSADRDPVHPTLSLLDVAHGRDRILAHPPHTSRLDLRHEQLRLRFLASAGPTTPAARRYLHPQILPTTHITKSATANNQCHQRDWVLSELTQEGATRGTQYTLQTDEVMART